MEGHSESEKRPQVLKKEVERTPMKKHTKRKLFGEDEASRGAAIMSPSYAFPTTPRGQEAVESYFTGKKDLTPRHIDRYMEYREHCEVLLAQNRKEIFGDRDDISVDDSDGDPTYKPPGRRSSLSDPTVLGTADDMEEEFSGFSEGSGEEGMLISKKRKLMKVGERESGEVVGESGEAVGESAELLGETGEFLRKSVGDVGERVGESAKSPKDKKGKIKGKSKERKEREVETSEREKEPEERERRPSEIGSHGDGLAVSRSESGVGGRRRGRARGGRGRATLSHISEEEEEQGTSSTETATETATDSDGSLGGGREGVSFVVVVERVVYVPRAAMQHVDVECPCRQTRKGTLMGAGQRTPHHPPSFHLQHPQGSQYPSPQPHWVFCSYSSR